MTWNWRNWNWRTWHWRTWGLAIVWLLMIRCATLDGFLYTNEAVESYAWDVLPCDPQLAGELEEAQLARGLRSSAGCHPSTIPPANRTEGFVTGENGQSTHFVYARHPAPIATLVYSHGRARHLGRYWDRIELLHDLGFSVVIYDYPEFGRSHGAPLDEDHVHASLADVLAHLPRLPGIDLERVFLYGYSLGAGPALHAAAYGRLQWQPRGVIVESAFCSVQALVEDGAFIDLPVEFVAEARYDNCAAMAAMPTSMPVLILHGDSDTFVRPFHAEALAEAANVPPELRWIAGADHGELPVVGAAGYRELVTSFVLDRLGPPAR